MPCRPLPRSRRALRHGVLLAGVLAALALPVTPALAAPEAGDRIGGFLLERGLVETPAPTPAAEDRGLASRLRAQAGAASDWASELVVSAMNFLGVRYHRGGDSVAEGFDCSGFTRHVFENSIGLVLPRRSQEQARAAALKPVERGELRPGDLVFLNTLRAAFSHVGIYIGDGRFIHAPRSGAEVRVEDMRLAYWSRRYDGARRAALPAQASPAPQAPVAASPLPPAATGPAAEP